MPLILGTNSIKDTGYDVANSLRFDDGSSDYLSRTTGTPTSDKIGTLSFWVKRTRLGSPDNYIFNNYINASNYSMLRFDGADRLEFFSFNDPNYLSLRTNRLFRDTSAWYHIVFKVDMTQATSSNRLKFYVNGVEETSFSSTEYGTQNQVCNLFTSSASGNNRIGTDETSTYHIDGYMAEVCLIDGQALDPTSFGEFDEDSPTIWKPKDVSGLTFGTNGFYLDFEDSSALGNDVAGSNNFTVNNLTAIDQSTDTCTNNFATLNPLATNTNTGSSNFSEGNLELDRPGSTSSWVGCINTMGVTQGKWYAEYKVIDAGDPQNGVMIGVTNVDLSNFQNAGNDLSQSGEFGINYYAGGTIANNGSNIATYTAMSDGDIVMIALDIDNGKIYWGRNGTWENSGVPTSGSTGTGAQNLSVITTGDTYCFHLCCREDGNVQANYGSPPYAISSGNTDGNGYGNMEFAIPSGYFCLNSKNLAEYG